MFLITLFALLPEVSRGQCPDSTWALPPNTGGWIQDSTYQQIPGTSCYEMIYFCFRDDSDGDTAQVWVNRIAIDSSTDCDSVDFSTAITAASTIVYNDPRINFSYPCDKNEHPYVIEAFIGICWEQVATVYGSSIIPGHLKDKNPLNATAQWQLTPCGKSWCEHNCQVCEDRITHEVHITNCTWLSSGSPGCVLSAPTYPTKWIENVCYNLGCNSTRGTESGQDEPKVSGVSNSVIVHKSVTLTPNPAREEVECAWSGSANEVELIDVLGNIIQSNRVTPTASGLNISLKGLSKGSYYVRIVFTNGSIHTYPLSKLEH